MHVVSVQVGAPRAVEWRGEAVTTAIFKEPVSGPVHAGRLRLRGDAQADHRWHGGVNKAIYAYPAEHYPYWREIYPDDEFRWGNFGENLTTEGLIERELHIGDRFRVGTTEVEIAQPRMPCMKLGIRLGHADAVRRFELADRPGFYLRVVEEGELSAGDPFVATHVAERAPTVMDIVELARAESPDPGALHAALALETLGPEWTKRLSRHLV
jgi:MOSC domain-containing protein YiiM